MGGDLENPESLAPAFHGVDRMYLLATGDTRQIVDLAKQTGVRRTVVLSSASAGFENDPGGEFHRAAERAVEDSGPEWTHVRPGMFAGNLLDWAEAIRTGGVVKAPCGAARQSPVHELDIAAVAATALLSDGHHGKIYTLSRPEALTKTEQVAAISKAIGRDIRFEELNPRAVARTRPGGDAPVRHRLAARPLGTDRGQSRARAADRPGGPRPAGADGGRMGSGPRGALR